MSNQNLFRKKSLEKIQSPDHLTDYIQVATPSAWMSLVAVIIMLLGICVWGIFGHITSNVSVAAISDGSTVTCYVPAEQFSDVKVGQNVTINQKIYQITDIDEEITVLSGEVGTLKAGQGIHKAVINAKLPSGIYQAGITTEVLTPASFLFN